MTCSVEECERPAHARGLCRGHYERVRKEQPLHTPLRPWGRPGWQILSDAALRYADAPPDDEREFRLAKQSLRMARTRSGRKHKV